MHKKTIGNIQKRCWTVISLMISQLSWSGSAIPTVKNGDKLTTNFDAFSYIWETFKDGSNVILVILFVLAIIVAVMVFKEGLDDYREKKKLGPAIMTWFVGGVSIIVILGFVIYALNFLKNFSL